MNKEQKNKILSETNTLYENLYVWLTNEYLNSDAFNNFKDRYITYYMQILLVPSVYNIYSKQTNKNVLEIGCCQGNCSQSLSRIAQINQLKYFALDPWNGAQEGNEGSYQEFLTKIEKSSSTIFRKSSQDNDVLNTVYKDNNIGFVFVDGLHHDWSAYKDIKNAFDASTVDVICVDDLSKNENRNVETAWRKAIGEGLIEPFQIKETYYNKITEYKEYSFAFINK